MDHLLWLTIILLGIAVALQQGTIQLNAKTIKLMQSNIDLKAALVTWYKVELAVSRSDARIAKETLAGARAELTKALARERELRP